MGFYARWGKRGVDLALVAVTAPVWLPLLGVVAILVRLRLGPPVFFRQTRVGRGGDDFELWKFRTLNNARDAAGRLLPDAQRRTRFGQWLRRTSLDELPELFHVLRGQMSLVGPRPLLPQYVSRYSPEQARRHEILPGLTGWAQIHGRNTISWEEKFRLDVWYVDHVSLALDFRILAVTVLKTWRREDVLEPDEGPNREFGGRPAQPTPGPPGPP